MEKKRIGKDWRDQKKRIERKGDKEGILGLLFISSFFLLLSGKQISGKKMWKAWIAI